MDAENSCQRFRKSAQRPARSEPLQSLAGRRVHHTTFSQLRNDGFDVRTVAETPKTFTLADTWSDIPPAWRAKPIESIPAEIVVAEDCYVFPTGAVLIEDHYICSDLLFLRDRTHPRQLGDMTGEDSLAVARNLAVAEVGEPLFVMTNFRATNFYHFVHEIIGRLYFLERAEEELGRSLAILISPVRFPMQSLLLEAVFGDRRIIYHRKRTIVRANEVVLSRQPVNRYAICVPAIQRMGERLKGLAGSREAGQPVYVSRRDTSNTRFARNLANEDVLLAKLERYGFRVVVVSDVAPAEQLRLFSQAEAMVGIHGAGLSNIAFMLRGAVMEISGFPVSPDYFARDAQLFGLDYGLAGTSADETGGIRIDMHAVDRFIDRIFSRRADK